MTERGSLTSIGSARTKKDVVPYNPAPEWTVAYDNGPGAYKYNHDSTLVKFGGEWWLAWNGNTTQLEGVTGQKNLLVRASEWNQFIQKTPISPFQDVAYATNPTDPAAIEWHPTFLTFNGRLECWWFATANSTFTKALGYKSVWDPLGAKWTSYKIQMSTGGTVAFSNSVLTTDAADRVTVGAQSLVPMPLATAILGANGRIVMPMLLSNVTTGAGVGTSCKVAVMYSDDGGDTWLWSGGVIPMGTDTHRTCAWEPWMTFDGTTYRCTWRNFVTVPIGKGYSMSESTDLITWTTAVDSPLDVMPMRGETVQDDSGHWYNTLAERALATGTWNSNHRRPVSLWRARNGRDWLPLAPLFPSSLNTFYCFPYIHGGYLYSSTTMGSGIAVSRLPLPPADEYVVAPRRDFSVTGFHDPAIRDGAYKLAGWDYLRPAVAFNHASTGWSIAALVRGGTYNTSVAADFLRRSPDSTTYGNGLLPSFDAAWEFGMNGGVGSLATVFRSRVKPRAGCLSFIGVSFDETDQKLRIVRRNAVSGDTFESFEFHVRKLVYSAAPLDGAVTNVNGLAYTWRTTMPGTTAVTGTAATDIFDATAHGFANGTPLWVIVGSGLAGITTMTTIYYVVSATANTFQLSATLGGAAVNFTTDGAATVSPTLSDIPIGAAGSNNMTALRNAVAARDATVAGVQYVNAWSAMNAALRNALYIFTVAAPGTTTGDGTRIITATGNIFDVPTADFTINGANNITDPRSAGTASNQPGCEIYRLGLWNSRLTTDDFRSLFNRLQPIHNQPYEPVTSSTATWAGAGVLLDPTNHNSALGAVEAPGHLAQIVGDVVTIPGDAAVTVEVPGTGDWTFSGTFSFDLIPASTQFDLLAVGDKFKTAKLIITRDSGTVCTLISGVSMVADGLASTDVLTTHYAHGLNNGDAVTFAQITSGLAGLVAATTYYVRDVTSHSLKLAATNGGAVIDITSNGFGILTKQGALAHVVKAGSPITVSINYTESTRAVALTSPATVSLADSSVRPMMQLGRFISNVPGYLTVNRSSNYATRWSGLESY